MTTIDRRIVRAAGFLLCAVFVCTFITPTARAQWNQNGNLVAIGGSGDIRIIPDGMGGSFIAWTDYSGISFDIRVQHIDPAGNPMWAPGGVNVSAIPSTSEMSPDVIADGAGGVFIVWEDFRDGHNDIYMQRVDAAGIPAWAGGIGVVVWPGDQFYPSIVSDGSGGIIVAWTDDRNPSNIDVRAQHMNASGVQQWGTGGVIVCNDTGPQGLADAISDDAGGIICVWKDLRNPDEDIYAGRLNASGFTVWSAAGEIVCNEAGDQLHAPPVSDGAGGVIVTWEDWRGVTSSDIYAQRIDDTGTAAWRSNGEIVSDINGDQTLPSITADGTGGAIVAWTDARDPANRDIYAQRIDADGNVRWTYQGLALCAETSHQGDTRVERITPDIFAATWADSRGADTGVYAQGITLDGATLWADDGVLIADGDRDQLEPEIAADATGVAIIAFDDRRSGRSDIYCQRIEWRHGAWGIPEPEIAAVDDVAGDQGGYVTVKWNRSDRDRLPQTFIADYRVWRALEAPDGAAAMSAPDAPSRVSVVTSPGLVPANPDKRVIWKETLQGAAQYWEWVGTHAAQYFDGYSATAPTTADFMGPTQPNPHWFKITAHAQNPLEYWESWQMTGSSVDNLAPASPMMLTAHRQGANVELEWNPSGEGETDFKDYVVYRGTASGVTPEPIFYLSETPDSLLTDPNVPTSTLYYIVTSRDIHDNQSAPSNEASVSPVTGIGTPAPVLTSLQVRANVPNPFSNTTELRIGLPAATTVTVGVYDVAGRRVATREAALSAGWQTLRFDGRDANGRPLPTGVYFYRINAAGETTTRKLVIHR